MKNHLRVILWEKGACQIGKLTILGKRMEYAMLWMFFDNLLRMHRSLPWTCYDNKLADEVSPVNPSRLR
jgi:hypothetical protein